MSDIRTLLMNARQNVPPLNKTIAKEKPKEIILIGSKKNSIIKQFVSSRKKDESLEKEEKCRSTECWQKIREKMLIEMEQKRNLEWEQENLNKRLEDEKLNEDVEEELTLTDDDDNQDDTDNESVESDKEKNEEEKAYDDVDSVEYNDGIHSIDDDELDHESQEQKISENIPLDNQKTDKDDIDNDECLFRLRKYKRLPIIDDEDEENHEEKKKNENGENFDTFSEIDPHIYSGHFDYQEDDIGKYVSQNLPLTPFETVDLQNHNHNNNHFDSQMLMELCSGRFNDGNDDDENEHLESTKKKPKALKIKDFLEDEAELSGDEDEISSDESDDENDQEFVENLIEDDGLPHDDELKEQVEKIHK